MWKPQPSIYEKFDIILKTDEVNVKCVYAFVGLHYAGILTPLDYIAECHCYFDLILLMC